MGYRCAGANASQLLPEDKIIVQTGSHPSQLLTISRTQFNPFGLNADISTSSLPARVLISKLMKIED